MTGELSPDHDGPQRRRSRIRRQEILDTASDTFGAKGYHATSLADIAGQVGITPAGILHHFGTKDVLLTELLRQRDSDDIAEVKRGDRPPHGMAFLQHLVDTAYRNQRRRATTQLYAVLSAESVTDDHPAQQWFRERYAGLRQMIMDAIGQAQTDGAIAAELDPGPAARAIIAVMDGLQIQWLLAPDGIDLAAETRRAIEALVGATVPLDIIGGGGDRVAL